MLLCWVPITWDAIEGPCLQWQPAKWGHWLWECWQLPNHPQLQDHPQETCWLNHSIWSSRRCTAMCTWWCTSHTATGASSYENGLICLYRAWAPGWNSGGGSALKSAGRIITAPAIWHIPTYARGDSSQILRWTGRSSWPLHHHRGFFLATSPTRYTSLLDVSYICPEHPRLEQIHGGDFHLWIPFRGGLPTTLVDGPITFSLAMCGGMVEHPMEDEGPLQTLWPPLMVLIQEDIGIQLPFCLLHQYTFFGPQSLSGGSFLYLASVA